MTVVLKGRQIGKVGWTGNPPGEHQRKWVSLWSVALAASIILVEWHQGPGAPGFPRVGFIVTNLGGGSKPVVDFYNRRGTAEVGVSYYFLCNRFYHVPVRGFGCVSSAA